MSIPAVVQELAVYTTDGQRMGPPLLVMLQDAVASNLGRTRGGASSPSQRIAFDADTYELREEVTGRIASMFNTATDLRPSRSARFNLLAWANEFEAATDRDEITDMQRDVALEQLTDLARRIRRHFDRPTATEITAPCPRCGLRWTTKGTGEEQVRTATLWSSSVPGEELTIECANPTCGARWHGDAQVIQLGGLIGIELNPAAIREARAPVLEANQMSSD